MSGANRRNTDCKIRNEDLLNEEFLNNFIIGDKLNDFLQQLDNHEVEKMLEAELDSHLSYDKNQNTANCNALMGIQTRD